MNPSNLSWEERHPSNYEVKPIYIPSGKMTELEEIHAELNLLIDRELNIEQPPLSLSEKTRLGLLQKRAHELGQEMKKQATIEKEEKKARHRKTEGRWKKSEDIVCADLGLKRMGHIRRGVSCPDGVNDMFSVDVTDTANKCAFQEKELIDAEAHSSQGRTPLVIIFRKGELRKNGHVLMRYSDCVDLFGAIRGEVNIKRELTND